MKINPPPLFKKRNSSKKGVFKLSKSSKKWWGVNQNIFRAYDIRGIYPKELNEDAAYFIGQAFVKFLGKKNLKIVVGRDNRISSPPLFKALSKGIISQGGSVIDIGLSTTPMLYFAVAHYKYDGGIEISASHNPPQYNGFKLVKEKAIPISEKTGLKEIKKIIQRAKFKKGERSKIRKKKILSDYLKFNLREININRLKPLKIVVDTANAAPGILIPYLERKLPIQIYSLFEKLDGNFPNHFPNPLIKENLKSLRKEVKTKKVDLGVAFDGDGDRIIFVDENGKIISGDLITALISILILKKNPGAKILYDIRSSRAVREFVKENQGRPVVWRVGHSFIKEKMRRENIIFGGEFSGHYYLKKHYFSEAPFFVLFKILETLSETKKNLSQLIKPLERYFCSGEINFKVKDKKKTLKLLEKKYQKGEISHLGGLRIDFKDWWFLARPSGTEDLLRLIIEAETKKLMIKKKKELTKLIPSFS